MNVYATMEDIREHALRHNPAVGIHVALLYQSGWFLHWAEGPKQAVRTLFDRIRQDPRHHDQTVVHHSRGRRLLMTTWSMLLSPSTETPEQFGHRVLALREQILFLKFQKMHYIFIGRNKVFKVWKLNFLQRPKNWCC